MEKGSGREVWVAFRLSNMAFSALNIYFLLDPTYGNHDAPPYLASLAEFAGCQSSKC